MAIILCSRLLCIFKGLHNAHSTNVEESETYDKNLSSIEPLFQCFQILFFCFHLLSSHYCTTDKVTARFKSTWCILHYYLHLKHAHLSCVHVVVVGWKGCKSKKKEFLLLERAGTIISGAHRKTHFYESEIIAFRFIR